MGLVESSAALKIPFVTRYGIKHYNFCRSSICI